MRVSPLSLFSLGGAIQPRQAIVVCVVVLNSFTTPMMLSATNVALPSIAADFSLSAKTLSWVPMSYLMACAMFILIFGRMSDLFGRKRLFLLGTASVIVSSVLAATSVSAEMLVVARFLQGISAAMLYATQMALISSVIPAGLRGKAIGLVVASVYTGLASGPLIGGIATDLFGWRANFLLHIPLALVVLHLGLGRIGEEWTGNPAPLDLKGAGLFSLVILLLCLGISRLPALSSVLLLLLFLAALTLFVRHARAAPNPVWDIRLFLTNPIFARSCGASLIMYTATYANVVLLSLYLQELKSLGASQAGLVLVIQPLAMALLSPASGRLSDRLEPRLLASLGMAVTAIGLWFLSTLTAASAITTVAFALAMTGVGFSLFSPPNANAIMSAVDKKDYGSASGALATTRIIGQLNSMVLVTLALSLVVGDRLVDASSLPALEQSIQLSFAIAAVICLPGILLSVTRGRMHQPAS